ncbi:asialoglycoprotein receptor 2-like [Hoplias malabaricus]|uniref:asialoglycoprotein receptor 2-like n=1 Tax=Hoplias malabaricus TaxID=27720 RepID=UPI003461ECB7
MFSALKEGDACCAKGWKYFSGKCYYFSTDYKTWTASRDACVAEGGDLVIVSSTEEQDFLNRRILLHYYYWVGLTDAVKEGDWRWLDGTPLSATPRIWYSNQPDNWKGTRGRHSEGEDCAAMALRRSQCVQSQPGFIWHKTGAHPVVGGLRLQRACDNNSVKFVLTSAKIAMSMTQR